MAARMDSSALRVICSLMTHASSLLRDAMLTSDSLLDTLRVESSLRLSVRNRCCSLAFCCRTRHISDFNASISSCSALDANF